MHGVITVRADQCMMGLVPKGVDGETQKAMKPTRFMSNSEHILGRLECRCDGSHVHQPLIQGRAKAAAIYPVEMCELIIEGLKVQMERDLESVNEVINLIMNNTLEEGGDFEPLWSLKKGEYIDDVHGVPLNAEKVIEARGKEMTYFR